MKSLIIAILFCAVLSFFAFGCEETFRLAPTEAIKQSNELTFELAKKIDEQGTDAKSPASQKMVQGTLVSLNYSGRPKEPPDPEQFDTIVQQGQVDAQERPDAWQIADSALELGIGIAALFGGVAGMKGVKLLSEARAKSKALKQIIEGNELFKVTADEKAKKEFAEAQNAKQTLVETKKIVADVKLSA